MSRPFVRLLPLLLLLAACSASPPYPDEVDTYNRPDVDFPLVANELRLIETVAGWARAAGREPPELDAGLTLTCRSLAWWLESQGSGLIGELSNADVQDEMVRFGVSDSAVRTQLVSTFLLSSMEKDVGESLHQDLASGLYTHQMGGFDRDEIAQAFGFGDDLAAVTVMAVGALGDIDAAPEALREREQAPRTRRPIEESLVIDA